MRRGRAGIVVGTAVAIVAVCSLVVGQDQPKVGFTDTPMLPGGKWHVHDGNRPMPAVITPGTCSTQEKAGSAPSDAVVLFDGTDLSHWRGRSGKPAAWKIDEGALVIAPGAGEILSKDEFGDCQLHLEFAAPVPAARERPGSRQQWRDVFWPIRDSGARQLSESHLRRRPGGGDLRPVSAAGQCLPPAGPVADVRYHFQGARFRTDRSLESPAYVTMLHNGVLVHDHRPVIGAMAYRAVGKYTPHGPKGPILLQDHGNPVRFRNIWVRAAHRPRTTAIIRPGDAEILDGPPIHDELCPSRRAATLFLSCTEIEPTWSNSHFLFNTPDFSVTISQ